MCKSNAFHVIIMSNSKDNIEIKTLMTAWH